MRGSGGGVRVPSPLLIFSILLVLGAHFACWLGSSDAWWRPKEWWVFMVGLCWTGWQIGAPPERKRVFRSALLSLFLLFIAVQMAVRFIGPSILSHGKFSVPIWPWLILLHILLSIRWFSDCSESFTDHDLSILWRVIGSCGTLLASLMILQAMNLDPITALSGLLGMNIRWLHDNHVVGLMGNSFQAACVIAPIAPILLAMSWLLPCALSVAALVLAGSSSALVAGLVGLLAVLWMQGRKKLFFTISFLLAVSSAWISSTGYFSFSGRLELWKDSVIRLLQHPILGYGLGTYKLLGLTCYTGNGLRNAVWWAHNEWIHFACELGLLGLCILTLSLGSLIVKAGKRTPEESVGAIVSLGVLSLASVPFHLAPSIIVFLVSLIAIQVRS